MPITRSPTVGTGNTVPLPPYAAGDRFELSFGFEAPDTLVVTWPSGWTPLIDHGQSNNNQLVTAYRDMVGDEGSEILVTNSAGEDGAWLLRHITGQDAATPPETVTPASADFTASPNPPAISPSWGAEEGTLYCTICTWRRASAELTGYPAEYTENRVTTKSSDTTGGGAIAGADRLANVATEDASSYTLGSSRTWIAAATAHRAATGGGGPVATDLGVPFAAAAGQDFAPGLSEGIAPVALAVPFSAGAGAEHAPTVAVATNALSVPYAAAAGADHAPAVAVQAVPLGVPYLGHQGADFAPGIEEGVPSGQLAVPFAAEAGAEWAPGVAEGEVLAVPYAPSAGAEHAPTIAQPGAISVPFAGAEGADHAPALSIAVVALQVPLAGAAGADYVPGVQPGALTLLIPFSPSAGLAFAPGIRDGAAPIVLYLTAARVRLVPALSGAVELTPALDGEPAMEPALTGTPTLHPRT